MAKLTALIAMSLGRTNRRRVVVVYVLRAQEIATYPSRGTRRTAPLRVSVGVRWVS